MKAIGVCSAAVGAAGARSPAAARRPAATRRQRQEGRARPTARARSQARRRQGRRRDADRLGPGGPRRPGRSRSSSSTQQFQAKYPNVKIKRVGEVVHGPQHDAQARGLRARTRRTSCRPTRAARMMGAARQGRAAAAARRLRGGLRLERPLLADAARPQHVLDRRQASSAPATSTALSQTGEIVGVFYNKDKVPTPPKTLAEFEAALAEGQGRRARCRSCSATSTSGRGIHEFETVLRTRPPTSRRSRDFVFAKDGATFDNAGVHRRRATKIKEWVDKGYFTKDFNGTGYDPAWQQFAKGKGPFLIAGTWLTADLAEAMGDKVGFMLMPGRRTATRRSRSAARACRGRSPRSPRTPTSRRPTSTSSPTPTPPRCWSTPTTCRR